MATRIHPTAIIAPSAELGAEVEVGPYSVIGPQVRIGARTRIFPHVVLDGCTRIGADGRIFPFASIGQQTQDLKFRGGVARVEIGDQTTLREYVTVNAATNDGDVTRIGSGCHIMAYAHVAHDCRVGNEVIISNCGTLAGHVVLEDQVIIGGLCGIHQFCRVGRLAITGGCSKITQDVPPFMMADGNPVAIHGLNSVGLKRHGASEETERQLKKAFRLLYREGLLTRLALERIEKEVEPLPEVQQLVAFVRASERGIVR
ncbi:MAG: acyl-ACP--UDP-N-acetylglucosamine O-acyltransferase [Kiritimatiellaeota bacterium]|nr:acyl-ACP--UDP-N-acetylglucosamine O-acyltransferase [Kiritimatiellota bacterium]